MINARPGYVAVFGRNDPASGEFKVHEKLEVLAWDDDGMPMVIPDPSQRGRHHRLARANDFATYAGVERDPFPEIVALIPAGGWRVAWPEDDGEWSEPLVGWGITTSGLVDALVTDTEGDVQPIDRRGYRIYHPDAETPG